MHNYQVLYCIKFCIWGKIELTVYSKTFQYNEMYRISFLIETNHKHVLSQRHVIFYLFLF